MNITTIIKSNGDEVPFDPSKLNRMAEWGNTVGVCWSELVFDALKKVTDRCKTKDLQQALIDACAEKQTKEHMDMAGRLYLGSLYKTVHGGFETRPDLTDFYYDMLSKGVWEKLNYDDTELEYLNDVLDNDKDLNYKLSTIKQISMKYSKKFQGEVCETPQYTFMGIAMKAMEAQPEERRLEDVTKLYTYLSDLKINMPTPFLAGLRTSFKGFASCCVIKSEDTADSIENLVHAAYRFTTAASGIGCTLTTRSVKDPIRMQPSKHTGKIPYYRYLQGAVKSTKQEVRGGGGTVHFTVLDPEVETLLRLKHPTTVEDRRIRGLDYSLGATKFLAEKAALKKEWMLVSYYDSPELYEAHFKGYNEFKKAYEEYEKSDSPRKYVNAFDVLKLFLTQRGDTGRVYHTWLDEMNTHTSFKDPIYSSNLCVSPETQILTDKGYLPIAGLEGETVNVWNGEEFSETVVLKTGKDQELVKVLTDNGEELECTKYHKFYVKTGYHKAGIKEVKAFELQPEDKLIKWELPTIEGTKVLQFPYDNGIFSADGTEVLKAGENHNHQQVILMDQKLQTESRLSCRYSKRLDQKATQGRVVFTTNLLQTKYFVPNEEYTVASRMDWLAGYLDGDGCYTKSGTIQAASVEKDFLLRIKRMLDCSGVSSSVRFGREEKESTMPPRHNGTGKGRVCSCKTLWVLTIASKEVDKLLDLGLVTERLPLVQSVTDRNCNHFVKVLDVIDQGRKADTFCFTEKQRGMGMFNGILTGQCQEIFLPTKGFENIVDMYDPSKGVEAGEIALCFLSCLVAGRVSEEEYEDVAYYSLLAVDNVIDLMEYPFPQVENTAKGRRSVGIGITNLAHDLAVRGLSYSSLEGKNYMHRLAEMHSYYLHKASLRLAKEKGNCSLIGRTKYPDGWLPIDTYNKNVDGVHTQGLQFDWESLRKGIIENGGIRNSVLEATPPAESSSQASETTNSLYPIREYYTTKRSGSIVNIFAAPDIDNSVIKSNYELAYDVPSKDIVDCYAIFQKFHGQGISGDLYTDYSKYPNEKVPLSVMMDLYFYCVKMGLKSLYYQNSKGGIKEGSNVLDDITSTKVDNLDEEDDCESCKM